MGMYCKVVSFIIFLCLSSEILSQRPLRLWYNSPASDWESSVPLGNGHLGAMPDGGVLNENIVLNDITLWSGGIQDADKPDAYKTLPEIRQLLFEGKNIEAQQLMSRSFVCRGKGSGEGNGVREPYGSYQVLGNLHLHYDYGTDSTDLHMQKYYRELSLDSAVAKTQFVINRTIYSREYFTGFENDMFIMKLSASQLHKVGFTLQLDRPEDFDVRMEGDQLCMSRRLTNGTNGNGMQYMVRLIVKPDGGKLIKGTNSLQLKNANSALIYISAGTDYIYPDFKAVIVKILADGFNKPYTQLKSDHIKKYRQLFDRSTLSLTGETKDNVPTDERLAAFAKDGKDNYLPVLYFQYGRYLLISSTRPNLLPPNLQGLWANTIETPWNGDYHLNINIQMNHWPLDVTNLGTLNESFFTLVKGLVKPGEETAKIYYNANGWVAHVITNVWGYTSPGEDYSWGSYNTGSAWLCQMLWNHYEFTRDTAYLRTLYPILKGSSEFYLSMLAKEPTHGWLVTVPSSSPENAFVMSDGNSANVCTGPTIDNQIIRFLFASTIASSRQLKTDDSLQIVLEKTITKLPPNQIGKDGRLMEWMQEYKESDIHHRHVSHLWGLYPGNEIALSTPELAKAAKASLNMRGDDGTGWSLAWKINFWARLHEGNRAFELLKKLLRPVKGGTVVNMSNGGGTYNNLFCAHPPFQIDGNFGGTAGIAEMLVQSQDGYIELIPALPDNWQSGSFSDLCVRGGAEISAAWENMKVTKMNIKAINNGVFKIKIPSNILYADVEGPGKLKTIVQSAEQYISLQLRNGDIAEIKFK